MLSKTMFLSCPFAFVLPFDKQPHVDSHAKRQNTPVPQGSEENGGPAWLRLERGTVAMADAYHHHGGQACSVEEGRSDRKILSPKGTEDGEGRDARHPTGQMKGDVEVVETILRGAHFETHGGAHLRCASAACFR